MRHKNVAFTADALVALGANLPSDVGSPAMTLRRVIDDLRADADNFESSSRLFRTPCEPKGFGPDYVNAAIRFRDVPDPYALLTRLHEIEASHGREREQRWGSRSLDLDLISWGDAVLPDHDSFLQWQGLDTVQQRTETPDQLILPHPRMQDRMFVLIPLLEIAPNWRHPVLGRTVAEMVADLPQADRDAVQPL